MSKLLIKRIFSTVFLLFVLFTARAEMVRPMSPPRLVNDFAGMLSEQDRQTIEYKLRAFADTTSTQIVVVTVPSLEGEAPSAYATDLAHQWGVGQKGKDNGVVVLVQPKTASQQGEVFIAVGYGLEGALPDATAKTIVDRELIPAFKEGRYAAGIDRATSVIMEITAGEYTADDYGKKQSSGISSAYFFMLALLLFFLFTPKRKGSVEIDGKEARAESTVLPFLFLGSMMGSGGRRDDFGSFSGGGGSFGGFGGGGFGGGGAGGSW